jgi:hypothetical protein
LHVKKPPVNRVLLVEDDVIYGKQILKAYQQLKQFNPELEVDTASLFATSQGKRLANHVYQVRNPPLLHEWTLLTNINWRYYAKGKQ